MFRSLLEWIRKQVAKIIPTQTIEEKLKTKIEISDVMIENIDLWGKMYRNEAPWVDNENIKSLNIPASIASEMARLVTIEMQSNITGPTNSLGKAVDNDRSLYLNQRYQKVVDNLRVETEYAAAKGGMIFKPYLDNNNDIAVEFVQADEFYPVEFNSSGDLIAVIFPEIITRDKTTYTRLEYHHMLPGNKCYISNQAFVKSVGTDGIGLPIDLNSVKEWEYLADEINIENINQPLFSYFKMPLANNKDSKSQLGVSVYSKAVDIIKEVDLHWSSILWEYRGTELAIDVPIDMFMNKDLPKGKERLFRQLDVDDSNKTQSFYQVFSPEIRDVSLFNGLSKILERVEFNCGLAYGTLSDLEVTSKTATEIRTSKQRSYATIVDIQKSLRIALEHLIESMNILADFYSITGKGEYEVSFDFDDSIVIDSQAEQAIMLNEVAAKLIKPEYYLMKRYGVTEEQAKDMLPELDTGINQQNYDEWE